MTPYQRINDIKTIEKYIDHIVKLYVARSKTSSLQRVLFFYKILGELFPYQEKWMCCTKCVTILTQESQNIPLFHLCFTNIHVIHTDLIWNVIWNMIASIICHESLQLTYCKKKNCVNIALYLVWHINVHALRFQIWH